MSQLKAYREYKYSGVEWVGDIPYEWKLTKLKFVSDIISGYSFKSDDYKDEGIPVIRIGDISNNINLDSAKKVNLENEDKFKGFLIKYGDILIAMTGATVGKTAVYKSHEKSLLNQRVGIFRSRSNFNNKYLSYIIASNVFNGPVKFIAYGGAQENIGTNDLGNIFIPITNLENQNIITQYLDHKTFQIDSLISSKERLIELLEEKRQAVITETVTKGLDPNVNMKDSGIEWIGEIPEHWIRTKLKYISKKIIDGAHHTPTYVENGIPFLRVTDLTNSKGRNLKENKFKYIPEIEHNQLIKRAKPEKGDMLLSKNGTIGITRVIDWDFEFSIFVSLCLIKFKKNKVNPYFSSYVFESKLVEQQIADGGKKSTIVNLHLEKIKEFYLFLPPISEQNIIVKYLKKNVMKYDNLVEIIELQISKLKEYRESIIYEAVTGKIDVRDYVSEIEEVY